MSEKPLARVLVVDDEAAQVNLLCAALRSNGYEAVGFTEAASALRVLPGESFEILITDLMMPEMNGIELLKAVLGFDPNLVGIIMTGQGTVNSAVEAMKAGAVDYILKPFKFPAVLPILSRAVEIRRLREENRNLQRYLYQRTTELEVANRELEAFSSSVSHDLRAPLRAIKGFTEILKSDFTAELSDEVQGVLQKVLGGADRMERLIDDLLRLSRLGRQPLLKRPIKLFELVQSAGRELFEEEGPAHVELHVSDLPDCIGDPSLLRQVFANLLSNSIKFTRQKDPAIIEVGARQESGRTVYFVRDNGVGFDMDSAENLFRAFQRLHSADEFEGNGIGLSIVHNIIQRHGGSIWAEAQKDKGATFLFSLPD